MRQNTQDNNSTLLINENDYVWIGMNRLVLKETHDGHINTICPNCHQTINHIFKVDGDENSYCSRKCAIEILKRMRKEYKKNTGKRLIGFGISKFIEVRTK